MKKTWLLSAGHGGLDRNGVYVTDPKFNPNKPGAGTKCYAHKDGTFIHEGVFNRAVRASIVGLIVHDGTMKWFLINHGYEDMPLSERCNLANMFHERHQDCVFIDIHGNAGKGNGFEVYTSKGETKSDYIADIWVEEMGKIFPNRTDRGEKDRDFYNLIHTTCPAILTESFFMDTLEDCRLMNSDEGVAKVALAHFNMMKRIDAHPNL